DDDSTRLVYADWLDEQGDERGGYLRGEVELAGLQEDDPRYPELQNELATLRWGIAEDWLAQAGKRFDRWLLGCPPTWKIPVIKAIREVTCLGLAEAKQLSESLPARIVANVPLHTAAKHIAKVQGWTQGQQGQVLIRVRPSTGYPGRLGSQEPDLPFS